MCISHLAIYIYEHTLKILDKKLKFKIKTMRKIIAYQFNMEKQENGGTYHLGMLKNKDDKKYDIIYGQPILYFENVVFHSKNFQLFTSKYGKI